MPESTLERTVSHQAKLRPVPTMLDCLGSSLHRRESQQRITVASKSNWVRLHAVLFNETALPGVLDRRSLCTQENSAVQ